MTLTIDDRQRLSELPFESKLAKCARFDRFHNKDQLSEEITRLLPAIQTKYKEFAELLTVMRNKDSTVEECIQAGLAYKKVDPTFQPAFALCLTSHAAILHWLIQKGDVVCPEPGYQPGGYYNEQMMGLHAGTVAVYQGETLLPEEVFYWKSKMPQEEFAKLFKENADGSAVAQDWATTGKINQLDKFRSDVDPVLANGVQEYLHDLESTSEAISSKHGEKECVVLMGPYQAGKTQFIQSPYFGQNKITALSLDNLKGCVAKAVGQGLESQDVHFLGAAFDRSDFVRSSIGKIHSILVEGAFTDPTRFVFPSKGYFGRKVILIEIAPRSVDEIVARPIASKGLIPSAVRQSAEDALRYRSDRMAQIGPSEMIKSYKLFASSMNSEGKISFEIVAEKRPGSDHVEPIGGKEALYAQLGGRLLTPARVQ